MYCPPEHLSLCSRHFLDHYFTSTGFLLKKRTYSSGGMFNPFRKLAFIDRIFARTMFLLDTYTFLNRLPIFDHMYSYYIKH